MSQVFGKKEVLIVADDLTGANDAAAQFAEAGKKTVTLLEPGALQRSECPAHGAGILSVSTESRNTDPDSAEEAVRKVVSQVFPLFPAEIVLKKVDSTLRGNIEAELIALCDAVAPGPSTPVIFAPAYPANGRTVSGGYALVDGIPISQTFAGRDALAPARSSLVASIFTKWRDRVGNLSFSVLEEGEESVKAEITRLVRAGRPLIVADTLKDEDLSLLARAAMSLRNRPIWAGSAGLAKALARETVVPGQASGSTWRSERAPSGGPTLVLYGSLNPASAAQVEHARRVSACRVIEAPHDLNPAATCEEIESLTSGDRLPDDFAVVSFNVPRHGSPDEMAKRVKAYFAAVAGRLMRRRVFSSLVLSGGDVGRAVLSGLRITSLTVEREVLPGVAFGRVCDGEFAGTGIVTKAGGFGDADALARILSWISTIGKVVET